MKKVIDVLLFLTLTVCTMLLSSCDSSDSSGCKHTRTRELDGYDATCETQGLTDGLECSSCGKVIKEQKIVEIKPHSFDDANDLICNICGFFNTDSPTFIVSEPETIEDDKIAVTVSLKNNPGIASIILAITYDAELELTKIEYNTEIGGQTVYPQELQSPVTLYWINGFADTNGDWILATLYFDISESKTGEYGIQISYNPDNVYNIAEENVDFEAIHGKIVIE